MNKLFQLGIRNLDDVARLLLPAIRQMGDSAITRKAYQGLRNLGANLPGAADDLVVVTKRAPGYQAPRPAFGTKEIPRDMGTGLIGQGADEVNAVISRVKAAQAPVPKFGPGSIPAGARPDTPLTRMRTGTPTRPMGPGQRGFTPLEGTQLRIPYTQPGKGAQMYSAKKSSVSPENVGRSMVSSIADESAEEFAKGVAREAAEAGLVKGRGVYNMGDGSPLPSALRNAATGARTVDLNALLKAAGMTTGAAGIGAVVAGLSRMGGDPTGETTESVTSPSAPLFLEEDGSPLGDMPSEVVPANPPSVGNIDPTPRQPTDTVQIVTSGGEQGGSGVREALALFPVDAAINKAMEPMSPERYTPERGGLAQYYADREAYARSGPARKQVGDMLAVAIEADPNLRTWAQQNPGLAYELVRRQMVDPNANQQPLTETVDKTMSEMGSDNDRTSIGNADSTAAAFMDRTPAAFDLKTSTDPKTYKELRRSVAEYQAIFNQQENILRPRGF